MKWSIPLLNMFELPDGCDPMKDGHINHCIHPEDYTSVQQAFSDAISGNYNPVSYRIQTTSGTKKFLRTTFSGTDSNFVFGTTQDITEITQKEIEIVNKEKELESITHSSPIMLFKTNTDLVIEYVNGNLNELQGSSIYNVFSPESHNKLKRKINEALGGKNVVHFEAIARKDKDKTTWYRATIKKVDYSAKPSSLFFIVQDVTDIKEVEQKVFHAITQSEERERNRIAAELHDGVNQNLAVVSLSLSAIEKELSQMQHLQHMTQQAKQLILETIEMTRKVSHELMPPELYNFGFLEAVSSLVDKLNRADTISYILLTEGEETEIQPNLAINLYRIIQEFIRNTQKHSSATTVIINIKFHKNVLEISIEDDGKGFDIKKMKKNSGIGVFNIMNRIKTFNGKYSYKTAEGQGVKLQVRLPLENKTATKKKRA